MAIVATQTHIVTSIRGVDASLGALAASTQHNAGVLENIAARLNSLLPVADQGLRNEARVNLAVGGQAMRNAPRVNVAGPSRAVVDLTGDIFPIEDITALDGFLARLLSNNPAFLENAVSGK